MAATRNKNTPGNYALEKNQYVRRHEEIMYTHATQGQAFTRNFAGNGLLMGRMAGRDLASNDCDIESALFGIGSTNLEVPKPKIEPVIHKPKSLNVMDRMQMFVPEPFVPDTNQRPMYLN
jgi:hypothetical protein